MIVDTENRYIKHMNILSKVITPKLVLYEQAIAEEPDIKSHYWYLGLILLLQGKEVEAQTTWALV